MYDFSKRTQVKEYLDSIVRDYRSIGIRAIFSLGRPHWNDIHGYRCYSSNTEIYIMFQNNMCLVFSYPFIDYLQAELRELTSEEKSVYEHFYLKDFFNGEHDIYSTYEDKIKESRAIRLPYADICDVIIQPVTNPYNKWINDEILSVSPNAESFNEIHFIMSNGKSFTLCADDADADGYTLVWSEDATETTVKHA